MILAMITKETDGNFISLISVIIKLLSIIVGTVVASLDLKKRGALVGIMVSFPYWIICILLSLLAAPIQFDIKMIFDFIVTVIIGMFAGVLIVNVRK